MSRQDCPLEASLAETKNREAPALGRLADVTHEALGAQLTVRGRHPDDW